MTMSFKTVLGENEKCVLFYLKSNDFFGQPNKSADRLWALVTPNYSQSKGLDWDGQGLCPFPGKNFTFTGPPMIYKSKKVGKKSESEEKVKKNCKNAIKKITKKNPPMNPITKRQTSLR